MTSVEKTAIDLTLAGLEDQTPVDAEDVTVPLSEVETLVAEAMGRISVSGADTHYKYLDDALVAGSGGITKTAINPGGDAGIELALPGLLDSLELLDSDVLESPAAAFSIDVPGGYSRLLLTGRFKTSAGSTSRVEVYVNEDTSSVYNTMVLSAGGSSVDPDQRVSSGTGLTALVASIPSSTGALRYSFLRILFGNADSGLSTTVNWRLAAPVSGARYAAGFGSYGPTGAITKIELRNSNMANPFALGSGYKLYGVA